ncbi:unnamed protein product [Alopecurus aequalis]
MSTPVVYSYFMHANRREMIFVRIWDRHVGQHITRWKPAEDGLWTLAATMLEIKKAEGGLSTTDESHIIFQQPCYQLEAFRATLVSTVAARRSLSNQVRQAVNIRNVLAMNDNIIVSTL